MNGRLVTILAAQVTIVLAVSACNAGGASGNDASAAAAAPPPTASTPAGPTSSGTSASAGSLSLGAGSYSVAQTATSVTLTVARSGGSSGAASVKFATRFGSALGGINYGPADGTLTWASGDASTRSIVIPILPTAPFTGTKSLTFALSSPTGASLGATASATISILGNAGAQPVANGRSIHGWVACDGTTDDAAGTAKAFAAAANGAFTLVVDCPVRLHIGTDIGRTVFIDNGTHVQFSGSGKFIVDNELIPAFVIADSSNIDLEAWNVEYHGGIPVNPQVTAYLNGQRMSNGVEPGNAFNDVALTDWLSAHRGIHFNNYVHSNWSGSTNQCAVLFITGDSSQITVNDMTIAVPAGVGGNEFVPVAFTLAQNFKANQTVGASTRMTSSYVSLPHDITFSNITLDGTYMGWVGNARNVTFSNITSKRYGDLEDSGGNNVGGVHKWFAPPHLFYLSYVGSSDPLLVNSNITISNVNDLGVRIGKARDKGGSDSTSGYALSLKIACNTCLVNGYSSARPDGFLDVLVSSNLTIENATATYDSSFLNNVYPGWRFPSAPYHEVSFHNVSITDTASESVMAPIGSASMPSNSGLTFDNVNATVQYWAGGGSLPVPSVGGTAKSVSLSILDNRRSLRIAHAETDALQATLQTSPANLAQGQTTQLAWSSRGAKECAASDAWAGSLTPSGARAVALTAAGQHTFVVTCSTTQEASTPARALVTVR